MLMCMESVMLWVDAMQLLLSMAGVVCHVCRNWSSTGSVWYVGSFKLCFVKFLLRLNVADMDCLLCERLLSEQC